MFVLFVTVFHALASFRAKLAAMLAQEDAQYSEELKQLEETPDMRRDRLKARARELIRRREQEKREFAQTMRERQVFHRIHIF